MNKKTIRFFKVVVFFAALILSIQIVSYIFTPKFYIDCNWPSTSVFSEFYDLDDNSIDVLFMGSSKQASAIIPQKIYNDYGITSYNLSCEQQTPILSYYWLKEALRYQKPQLVVFETNMLFKRRNYDFFEPYTRKALDFMKMSDVKREAIKTICELDDNQSELSYYFPLIRYHSRWNDLTYNDYNPIRRNHLFGYSPHTKMYVNNDYVTLDLTETSECEEFEPIMEEYFLKIVDLCQENNIELLAITTPSATDTVKEHNALYSLMNEHNIPYMDFNTEEYYSALSFNFMTDSSDLKHASYFGAEKTTTFLGSYIKEKYDIQPKSNELFENNNAFYNELDKELNLLYTSDISEYFEALSKLSTKRNIIFISAKDEASRNIPESVISSMAEMGLNCQLAGNERYSYYAVIDSSGISEECSSEALDKKGHFGKYNTQYSILSQNISCGNKSSIRINNREYSTDMRGLNIVVYSKEYDRIIDTVNFDTHRIPDAIRFSDGQQYTLETLLQ